MKIKKVLWEQKAITDRVEFAKRSIFQRAGSRVRMLQRKSIKPRRVRNTVNPPNNARQKNRNKRVWIYGRDPQGRYIWTETSKPGDPPFTHVKAGQFGIKWIQYDVDMNDDNVIIGPLGKTRKNGNKPVPEILEKGGFRINPAMMKKKSAFFTRRNVIAKRPSAAPALETFRTQYPDMWRDSVNANTPRIRRTRI